MLHCALFLIILIGWGYGRKIPLMSSHDANYTGRLPIIYVYTVVPAVCKHGLPPYIKNTLEQALVTQPDCDVIMASNYHDCPNIARVVKSIPNLKMVDISTIASPRTMQFKNLSVDLFQTDYKGELWMTSALRFFNLEDVMGHYKYPEMLHVEADNLLYGRLSTMLPTFRKSYNGLAATPLNDAVSFITASVFWISSMKSLQDFNDFLMGIASNSSGLQSQYHKWLRPFACCKHGGIDQDARGFGIKPFAVNEMSMLAYYHFIKPTELSLLPVVPTFAYPYESAYCNISSFSPLGDRVPSPTGSGIWDSNSWGQFLGGTSQKKGKNKGFIDVSHISGQAMKVTSSCFPRMICIRRNSTYSNNKQLDDGLLAHRTVDDNEDPRLQASQCMTAPHVRCHENDTWTPLWNLHVHSKHTDKFQSVACRCEDEVNPMDEPKLSLSNGYRLPIVFVYTVVPTVCKYGLPPYIRTTLEQALLTQSDCDIVMASNYADCPNIASVVERIPHLKKIDISQIASRRTKLFQNLSTNIFQKDNFGELWLTSALRFFNLEDIMIKLKYHEMMHVEADNLLYSKLSDQLATFRKHYPGMAATPLNADLSFITASVFWIADLPVLRRFTDYLMELASSSIAFKEYLVWLRPFACCKRGGVDQDKDGNGIKPFAVNEMSMIGHYHSVRPKEMMLLPVVPAQEYLLNRYVVNMSQFGPNGYFVGAPTGHGIWDPNSWGQYIGGTHRAKGNDIGFTDASHIAGQAIRTTGCRVLFRCTPHRYNPHPPNSLTHMQPAGNATSMLMPIPSPYYVLNNSTHPCLTQPHVQCGTEVTWTPIWNLHVHSKLTERFISQPCSCQF